MLPLAPSLLRRGRTFLASGCAVLALGGGVRAEEVAATRTASYARYAEELVALAAWCDEQKVPQLAAYTRQWQPIREPGKQYIFFPSSSFTPPWKDASPSPQQIEWWQKFTALRKKQAAALFDLAKQALQAHQSRVAYELVVETVREFPDHEQARIIMGHQKLEDAWYTPFAAVRVRGGDVWHEKYGWIPKGQVHRYEQGQRFVNDHWIKAEEDARQHAATGSGWRIDTEHYAVLTDHSLEEGVALSRRLERLYTIWQQVFFTYHTSELELAKLFSAATVQRPTRKQHQVMCYRDRNAYNQALSPAEPNIGVTLGVYFYSTRTVYFFAGEEQDEGTVNHEATHQLFQETRTVPKDFTKKANFWVTEAVACYMESMLAHDGYVTLGGFQEGRVPAARERLLENHFYIPLAELTAIGVDALQRDERLPKIYSQSSGLAMFLMHAGDGKYRDALAAYVEAVYFGKADAGTLAKLTGKSYEELDREYREFMAKPEGK